MMDAPHSKSSSVRHRDERDLFGFVAGYRGKAPLMQRQLARTILNSGVARLKTVHGTIVVALFSEITAEDCALELTAAVHELRKLASLFGYRLEPIGTTIEAPHV